MNDVAATIKPINSYPSVYAIGHPQLSEIFDDEVLVEEKIDGSQFSFAKLNGELHCLSKGQMLYVDAPEKMFERGIEIVKSLPFTEGWVYRGEYLKSPKHNALTYERIPHGHIALFDIQIAPETYLPYWKKAEEAARLGIDCVPKIFHGVINSADTLNEMLDVTSCLGGCKVEGVVVKNYSRFTRDKKAMIGKYVSEAFKERHKKEWKEANPGRKDVVLHLISELRTTARWDKAIQHLRDDGQLEWSPRDIGKLIKEVPDDILSDSEDYIKDVLFKHFWPDIRRAVTAGLPEHYKQRLMESAFND